MTEKNVNETPTMAQVIQNAIDARLLEMHTCLPAIVIEYDASTQRATVRPQIKRQYRNGDVVELPYIRDVPVVWPRGGGSFFHLPIAAGDIVTLVFSERSLDEWKETGGSVLPEEFRKFNLSDAFAIPGGYPFNNIFSPNGEDVQLQHGNAKFRMTKSGKYEFLGSAEEILDLLIQALDTLSTTTTNTIFGPMKLNDFAKFATLKQKLQVLKA